MVRTIAFIAAFLGSLITLAGYHDGIGSSGAHVDYGGLP